MLPPNHARRSDGAEPGRSALDAAALRDKTAALIRQAGYSTNDPIVGVWSTAYDLMRWNEALDRDELGVSTLLQTPGQLDDGTSLDYAWALGVRTHASRPIYRHGGGWPGL